MNAAGCNWAQRTTHWTLIAAAVGCLAVACAPQATPATALVQPPASANKPITVPLFNRWPENQKPDLAIVLTGETNGYLKFCGCSVPQLGGFERRANLMSQLK